VEERSGGPVDRRSLRGDWQLQAPVNLAPLPIYDRLSIIIVVRDRTEDWSVIEGLDAA